MAELRAHPSLEAGRESSARPQGMHGVMKTSSPSAGCTRRRRSRRRRARRMPWWSTRTRSWRTSCCRRADGRTRCTTRARPSSSTKARARSCAATRPSDSRTRLRLLAATLRGQPWQSPDASFPIAPHAPPRRAKWLVWIPAAQHGPRPAPDSGNLAGRHQQTPRDAKSTSFSRASHDVPDTSVN